MKTFRIVFKDEKGLNAFTFRKAQSEDLARTAFESDNPDCNIYRIDETTTNQNK